MTQEELVNLKSGDMIISPNHHIHEVARITKSGIVIKDGEKTLTRDPGNVKMLYEIYHREVDTNDKVNHPSHYNSHPSGVECIDIIRHYCFTIGNAIKYLWRAGLKSEGGYSDKDKEIEDLEKAIWYINDRIKELKSNL